MKALIVALLTVGASHLRVTLLTFFSVEQTRTERTMQVPHQ